MYSDRRLTIYHPFFLHTGDTAKPPGHCQDLRPKRNPEAERKAQPPAVGLPDRRRRQQSADGRDDAASDGQHGGRGAGDGGRNESHGSGKGASNLFGNCSFRCVHLDSRE